MAYGVKRGYKAPGEFGISDQFGLGLAASAGIVAALVTDYQQQGETSAIYTINQWTAALGNILGFGDMPLWMVALGLVAIGAISIFYFQPITRQGAFAQGFGLLAVIMTTVPSDLAGGLEAISAGGEMRGLESIDPDAIEASAGESAAFGGAIVPAVFTPGQAGAARLYQVQSRQAAKYNVVLTVNFPEGIPDNIDSMIRRGALRGRLHNDDTGQTYNLLRSAGADIETSGNTLTIMAGVPARSTTATLWVRIECEGYSIEEQSTQATVGQTVNWTITMQPSSTPLFLQRLRKSYRY